MLCRRPFWWHWWGPPVPPNPPRYNIFTSPFLIAWRKQPHQQSLDLITLGFLKKLLMRSGCVEPNPRPNAFRPGPTRLAMSSRRSPQTAIPRPNRLKAPFFQQPARRQSQFAANRMAKMMVNPIFLPPKAAVNILANGVLPTFGLPKASVLLNLLSILFLILNF